MAVSSQLSSMITSLITRMLSETLVGYMEKHGESKTLTDIESTFRWMVENDVDFLKWVADNKPHWLKYLSKFRRIRFMLKWDTESFAKEIEGALESNGIKVDEKARKWIRRTLEQLRVLVYS